MRKTILITGASRGIGRAIALSIDNSQFNIVINYKKEAKKAEELVRIIRNKGINAIAVQADVSDFKQVENMYEEINKTFGKVDILINNAGISFSNFAQNITVDEWHEIFATNVDGVFYCTKMALNDMISNKDGVIINISSVFGQTGGALESHYSATKGAVISYSKALAKELAPSNIRVNVVAPGGILTDMTKPLGDEILDDYVSEIPIGRMGLPEDIANVVKFLISDAASYITGQVIAVNGGYYI